MAHHVAPEPELGTLAGTSNRWSTANTQHIVLSDHPSHLSMEISRTARLYFLLVLDLIFFVLEISIGQSMFPIISFSLLIYPLHPGYAVGSLALVADSFHMLKYSH